METRINRDWTAHLVISCDHAGLRPYFRELETEMLRVLARVDDPRCVKQYLVVIRDASKEWLKFHEERCWDK